MDALAVCLSQNSLFAGSLGKLVSTRRSSVGYLSSIAELKAGTNFTSNYLTIMSATPFENSMATGIQEKDMEYPPDNVQKNFELPRMPPWFVYVGSPKLYRALAGILRLVGLSLVTGLFHSWHSSSLFRLMSFLLCTYTGYLSFCAARHKERRSFVAYH